MSVDITKPIELYSVSQSHEAIATTIEGDVIIRRKHARTPFYWRLEGGELKFLDGRPQYVWAVRNLDPSRLTLTVDGKAEEVTCWQHRAACYASDPSTGFRFVTHDNVAGFVDGNEVTEHLPHVMFDDPLTAPRPWLTDEVKARIAAYISDERKRRKAKVDWKSVAEDIRQSEAPFWRDSTRRALALLCEREATR